jgi:hypothetical protein
MFDFFRFWLGSLSRCFHSRQNLLLENLALRQQLAVRKRKASPVQAQSCGQTLLGARAPVLVRLEAGSPGGHSRDRSPLAPRRLPPVLESDLPGETASRKEEAVYGGPRSRIPNGRGEPDLGGLLGFTASF